MVGRIQNPAYGLPYDVFLKDTMQKYSLLWLLPFLSFITGYFFISRLVSVDSVQAPRVIGLSLQDALKTMAASQLHGQIIAEKEEPDLADGLVLDQTPHAGQHIKISQPIYLTVARKPAPVRAPQCVGLQKNKAEELARTLGIRLKFHELESNYPLGFCFGQYPAADEPLVDQMVDVYISAGMTTTRIFPSCKGIPVAEVQEFCKQLGMKVQVFHEQSVPAEHSCEQCVVKDQKPLAGTLFDLKKPLVVQLIVDRE